MMLGASHVVDLGIDVPPEKFLDAVKEEGIECVAMSALLTTTMPGMKDTIEHSGLVTKWKLWSEELLLHRTLPMK